MRRFLAFLLLSLPMCAQTASVSGNVKSLGAAAISGTVKVRYALQNCGGNQPTVSGVVVSVAPVDIPANASTGAFSGSVYANKDAGIGTNALSCGGTQSSYYVQTLVINGVSQASTATQVLLYNGSTFDPSTAPLCVAGTPTSCKLTGMTTTPVLTGSGYTQGYVCHQNTVATAWTCLHNFGDPAVEVQVTDLNSHVIIPDSITFTDSNTVTIGFTVAQAGQAVIMRAGTVTLATNLQNVLLANPTTNQTIAGGYGLTNSGTLTSKFLNSVPYAEQFGASDIGGDINSADTGCVANVDVVCPISVSPQPGTALNFTTPIVLNTPNRVHLLDFGGTYLNYTPTTATTALTPDWIPAGGSGYIVAHGIRHLTLRNNGCVTNGGCGSLATGFSFGGTNSGMQNGYTLGLRVQGFGTGMTYPNTGSTSWGNDHFHCSVTHNTTGATFPTAGLEATNFFGCKFAVNGTALSNSNTADVYDFGGSMDSNTVAGYSGFGDYYAFGKHFENLGVTTLNYLNITSGASALFGGLFLDDQPSGTVSSMFTTSGGLLHVSGIHIFSGGRTITNLFNVSGGGHVNGDYATTSPSLITSPCANTTLCTLQINSSTGTTEWGDRTFLGDQSFQAGTGTVLGPLHFKNAAGTNLWDIGNKDSGGASTVDFVIASTSGTGLGQNMVARVLSSTGFWTNFRYDTAGTNNIFKINGVQISNGVTALPGSLTTTAATTDNVAITGVTSSSHCSLTATNSSAATNIATTFISAKAAGQITVTHAATASMTYDVLCTQN